MQHRGNHAFTYSRQKPRFSYRISTRSSSLSSSLSLSPFHSLSLSPSVFEIVPIQCVCICTSANSMRDTLRSLIRERSWPSRSTSSYRVLGLPAGRKQAKRRARKKYIKCRYPRARPQRLMELQSRGMSRLSFEVETHRRPNECT